MICLIQASFKHKASTSAVGCIVEVRKRIREALTEGDRDFDEFVQTKTGKILVGVVDLLNDQEGLIRLAEKSKFGYKLLDKIMNQKEAPVLIKDPELLKKIEDAEKELEKEDETAKRVPRRDEDHTVGRDLAPQLERRARRAKETEEASLAIFVMGMDTLTRHVTISRRPPVGMESSTTSTLGVSTRRTARRSRLSESHPAAPTL